MGVPAATEFLDLLSPQYIADLISWGAIGARTTESPSHRQLASGLSCAVGFKNGTDGGVQMAADALVACRSPHAFMGMTKMGQVAIFETTGNEDCHIILRGGSRGPNYAPADIDAACAALRKAGVCERVMVDCSHANSAKKYERQVDVARELARRIAGGEQAHPGPDDREPPAPRPAGPAARRAAAARRLDHRWLHRLGADRKPAARAGASRANALSRPRAGYIFVSCTAPPPRSAMFGLTSAKRSTLPPYSAGEPGGIGLHREARDGRAHGAAALAADHVEAGLRVEPVTARLLPVGLAHVLHEHGADRLDLLGRDRSVANISTVSQKNTGAAVPA